MPQDRHRTTRNRSVRRPAPQWLALAALTIGVVPAGGQGLDNGGFGSTPAARQPTIPLAPRREVSGLSEFATDEVVAEIRVRGNATVPASRITGQMQTRVGRPYDPRALAADIKKLASLPYFVTVRPLTRQSEAGRVIVLEVVERRTLRYVEYLGNEKLKDKKLAEETGLAVGGAIDPYAVEEGRKKIEALYRSNGYARAVVTVVEGSKPTDKGVTYSINEGPQEKFAGVEFEGNTFATDGQLKNKIRSNANLISRAFGAKLKRDEVDADIDRLTNYYRSFGFFQARVGRTIDLNDAGTKGRVRFAIHEGPRYAVRNVTFNGVEKFPEEELRAGLKLGPGAYFERAKASVDAGWLRQLYGSRGYVFADIQAETVFLEEPGKIDLVFNVQEGERWRVGKVFVKINGEGSHTRIQTALNRIGVRPGDILDTRKIQDAERRLKSSTIFASNPAQGQPPEISYRPSEETKRRLAEKAEAEERARSGVFRGQSPTPAGPQRRTSYKPPIPAPSVYQIEQSNANTPEEALIYSGTPYADPGPPENYRYGGAIVAPTGPAAAPVGYGEPGQVQSLGAAPPGAPTNVTPTQFGAPVGRAPPPPVPVNTQLFPTQVYAPTPVPPPNDPFADIYVNLEETQTGRFMIGAAVNSDAGLVGQIMLDERNFDWRRIPTSWQDVYDGTAFRGGGQRFRLEAAPGTNVQRYIASWQQPYLYDTPISLNLSGNYYDRRFDHWDERRLGGRVGLGYQWLDRDLSGSVTYRGERVQIGNPATTDLAQYAAVVGDNALHGFGLRLVNDTRDNPFLATEGYYLSGTVEQVIGSFKYARAEIDARTYYLLRERPDHTGRHVLTYQARLGFTGGNTPIYDRFYAGGFSTMRGFDFRGASPQQQVMGVGAPFEVGGTFLFLNTLEYMFPITADDMINGVVFVDHGTVNENVSLKNYRVAPGLGLRITVPAMGPAPIALDFAFPVADAQFDDKQVFTFNVGFQR